MEPVDFTVKVVSSGINWESIIVGAITIISSFLVASYAANKALKNSYSKTWWDKKEAHYSEIISNFHELSAATSLMSVILNDECAISPVNITHPKLRESYLASKDIFINKNKSATEGLHVHFAYVSDDLMDYYNHFWSTKHKELLEKYSESSKANSSKEMSISLNDISLHYNSLIDKVILIRNNDLKINNLSKLEKFRIKIKSKYQLLKKYCEEDNKKFK